LFSKGEEAFQLLLNYTGINVRLTWQRKSLNQYISIPKMGFKKNGNLSLTNSLHPHPPRLNQSIISNLTYFAEIRV
jgi:hypothetical protein